MSAVLTVLVVLLVAAGYLAAPRRTLVGTLVALLFQPLAVGLAGGKATALGDAMQRYDEGALAGLLVGVAALWLTTGRPPRLGPWFKWWMLYVAAACVSIQLQHSGWALGILGVFLVGKGFVYALAVQQVDWTTEDAILWRNGLLWALGVVLAFSIPDMIAPIAFRTAMGFEAVVDMRAGIPSVVSLVGHPGGYGFAMGAGALVALAVLFTDRRRVWVVLAVLFFVGAMLAFRRKTMVGLVVCVIFVLTTQARSIDRRLIAATAAAMVLLILPLGAILLPILVEGAQGYVSADALTEQARTALYAGSVLLAKQHLPFGVGVGRYGSAGSVAQYSDIYYEFGFNLIYGMSPTYSEFIMDTFWPQVLGETGVIGTIGFAGALVSMLRTSLRATRAPGQPAPVLALRLFAPMIAIQALLESIAAPTYGVAFPAALSCGLLALASADWKDAAPVPAPTSAPAPYA